MAKGNAQQVGVAYLSVKPKVDGSFESELKGAGSKGGGFLWIQSFTKRHLLVGRTVRIQARISGNRRTCRPAIGCSSPMTIGTISTANL